MFANSGKTHLPDFDWKGLDLKTFFLCQTDEKALSACLEPAVFEFSLLEKKQCGKRVVYFFALTGKTVAVVPVLNFFLKLRFCIPSSSAILSSCSVFFDFCFEKSILSRDIFSSHILLRRSIDPGRVLCFLRRFPLEQKVSGFFRIVSGGKKIDSLRILHHLVNPPGLVHVEIISITYVFKRLDSDWQRFHLTSFAVPKQGCKPEIRVVGVPTDNSERLRRSPTDRPECLAGALQTHRKTFVGIPTDQPGKPS